MKLTRLAPAALALALTLLAVVPAGCACRSAPSPTRIVIYDHGQATAVEPQSPRFRSIGEQAAQLVSQARDEVAALAFPWEDAARCTQEQAAVEVVFAEPGLQAGVHGAYTSALIPLDQEHEPGLVSVYLGRERYTLLVPTRSEEALAALCELAGVPPPPVRTGPLPPTVAPATPTGELLPAAAWPWPAELLFQPGDLPEGVQAGQVDTAIPEYMRDKYTPPEAAAGLTLEQEGAQTSCGQVQVYAYDDAARLQQTYRQLVTAAGMASGLEGVPVPGLGRQAIVFPASGEQPVRLYFQVCRSLVEVRLALPDGERALLGYAARLAQRLDAVQCRGAAAVPVLSPAPPQPTPTPVPTVTVAQVITPTVQRLPDPEGARLIRAYAFADAAHGWLALGATILATADGGATWRRQAEAPARILAMGATSPLAAWVETEASHLLTADGGQSWQRAESKPEGAAPRLPPPELVVAAHGERGYPFCGGQAPFAGAYFALDSQTAWAFCTSNGGDHYTWRRLYRTGDGGQSWELLTDDPPYWRYGVPDLVFIDGAHGWLAGWGVLSATDDGGRTWRNLGLVEEGETARAPQLLSPQQGFVIAERHNDGRNALLRTDDGGATWRHVYGAPAPAPWPSGPMRFFADGSGVGVDERATILATSDAGRNWAQVGELRGDCSLALQVTALSFVDREHGWATIACGGTPAASLYRTSDGGATWVPAGAAGPSSDGYVAVSFADHGTGYIVTEAGYLLRTDDGGATLAPVDGVAAHTRSLAFVTRERGWEVRGDRLFATADGGHTWAEVPLGRPVQQFALLPDGMAWLSTGGPCLGDADPVRVLMHSADGGLTWSEYRLGPMPCDWRAPWLDSLQFADARHGWLRSGAALYHTEDGGRSWQQLH